MSDLVDKMVLIRYEIIKKVGQGAYGQVWKVKDKKTGDSVALKRMFDVFRNDIDAQRTYRQIMYLQLFDHPNITKMLSCIRPTSDRDIYITMDYMDTDLSTAIKNNILKSAHTQFIFYQMCNAMLYLHSGQMIHRDLKPANILLNSKCQAKICDFGLIRSINKKPEDLVLTENVATRWYRAPEMLLGSQKYDGKVDVWSLGCILAEMATAKPLFQGTCTLNQLEKILEFTGKPTFEQFYETLPEEDGMSVYPALPNCQKKPITEYFQTDDMVLIDLLSKMLQFSPKKRASIEEVMNHPYLKKLRGKCKQKTVKYPFMIPHGDERLQIADYRRLIYDQISSGNKESGQSTSIGYESQQNPLLKTLPHTHSRSSSKLAYESIHSRGSSRHYLNRFQSRSKEREVIPRASSENKYIPGIQKQLDVFKEGECNDCRSSSKSSKYKPHNHICGSYKKISISEQISSLSKGKYKYIPSRGTKLLQKESKGIFNPSDQTQSPKISNKQTSFEKYKNKLTSPKAKEGFNFQSTTSPYSPNKSPLSNNQPIIKTALTKESFKNQSTKTPTNFPSSYTKKFQFHSSKNNRPINNKYFESKFSNRSPNTLSGANRIHDPITNNNGLGNVQKKFISLNNNDSNRYGIYERRV